MSDVRTEPLTQEEIDRYHAEGFLFPIRVLTDEAFAAQVSENAERLIRRGSGAIAMTMQAVLPLIPSAEPK